MAAFGLRRPGRRFRKPAAEPPAPQLCCGDAKAAALPPQSIPFLLGLGYGTLGQIFFVLAVFESLSARAVVIVLAAAFFVALSYVRNFHAPSPLILIGALPSFILALYPPTGWDATAYHLPYARLFAEAGSLVFAGTLRYPVFPQLGEMWFAAALLVASDVAAQLTQWLALVITAAAVSAIVAELGGTRARSFAVALFLGTPLAIYLGANAYIDSALTMSVTLAFGAWLIRRRTSHPAWIALAGAFAGMAAATKYHGLVFLLVLFIAAACVSLRASAIFAAPALLFAAPWYARIAYTTGNPVFPFFARLFGPNDWGAIFERDPFLLVGIPADPILAIIRRGVTDRIALGMPPHSPWILVLLPLAIAAAVIEPRLRFPIGVAVVWTVLMSPFDWRFMMPVVPLFCVAIALILERLVPAHVWKIATAALLLPGFVWASILIAKNGAIPHTPAQRNAFLARKIDVYRALQFAGESTSYVLDASNGAYYCRGRCIGELLGPYRYEHIMPLFADPPHLAAALRGFGARYLIVRKSRPDLPFRRAWSDDVVEVYEVP